MPEPEYKHPYPRTNYIPAICSECGAAVVREPLAMLTHNEWHQKIDELIEWAQAVSKLFSGPQKPEKFGMTMKDIYPTEAGIQHDGA